jgi:serine/threonine protein kinase
MARACSRFPTGSRSDLYSLGVTFYRMPTGTLPFNATDPMEWVYCQITRKPVSPRERLATIPQALSELVIKLLAKVAEDRYQTAAGLEHDLWSAPRRVGGARGYRRLLTRRTRCP